MAVRKREDEVFPNAVGIDIGASSHWVLVSRHLAEGSGEEPVCEVGAMTDDLYELARWLVKLGVDTASPWNPRARTGSRCSRCWSSTG